MKLINNWKYWVIGLFGWITLIILTLTIDKVSYGLSNVPEAQKLNYLVYNFSEGIACGVLGFILSFFLLFYLEKYFVFGKITKKNVRDFVLIFLGVQLLYSWLLWPMLDFVMNIVSSSNNVNKMPDLDWFMRLSNATFFAAMFFMWFFVVFVFKGYYYIKNITLKQLELEHNLKESQLNILKGQINPHFMFNSLNNIRGLMLEDVGKSRDMLTKLSEMLRYSLIKNDVDSIPLEEELEMIQNYIALAKIQFEDRLEFIHQVEPEALTMPIPPMIIQLLVENAAKHGIANLKEGGKITLIINTDDKNLSITVKNTGKLKIDGKSTQLGLKNIKKRLKLLYGYFASFSLNEIDNEVVASIKIPINEKN